MNLPSPHTAPVRPVISRTLGVFRDKEGLEEAVSKLLPIAESNDPDADPAVVGLMIAVAALQRETKATQREAAAESRAQFAVSWEV